MTLVVAGRSSQRLLPFYEAVPTVASFPRSNARAGAMGELAEKMRATRIAGCGLSTAKIYLLYARRFAFYH